MNLLLQDHRCQSCNKLLFKGILVDSVIEVKCNRCGNLSTFEGKNSNELICLISPCPNRISLPAGVP